MGWVMRMDESACRAASSDLDARPDVVLHQCVAVVVPGGLHHEPEGAAAVAAMAMRRFMRGSLR